MDFTKLDTKTGATKGAFLHLRHPALGHRLYTGEGATEIGELADEEKATAVGCHVVGLESEQVKARARRISAEKLKRKDAGKPDPEQVDEDALEFVCSLVTGFVGVERDGKPMDATDANKRAFFEMSNGLVEQVISFASDRANFFGIT